MNTNRTRQLIWTVGLVLALVAVRAAVLRRPPSQRAIPIAQVGTRPVFATDVAPAYRARLQALADTPLTVEGRKALWRASLDDFLWSRVLREAARVANVTVLDDEVEAALQALGAPLSPSELEAEYVRLKIGPAELRRALREGLLVGKYLYREVASRVAVQEADVAAFAAAHPEQLALGERVQLRQLVLGDPSKLEEARKAARKAVSFSEVAARFGTGPEAARGGALGWFAVDQLPKEFAEALTHLPVRKASEPVAAADGLHVLWVAQRLPPERRSLAEAQASLEGRVRREQENQRETAALAQLWHMARVEVLDDALPHNW